MVLFITYCSAEKVEGNTDLPAGERYRSTRIRNVCRAAEIAGVEFRILSGLYGLLATSTPIPYYDHLLVESEVTDHSRKVGQQLTELQPARVVLFTRPVTTDPDVAPYHSVLQNACDTLGISCTIVEIADTGQDPGALVHLAAEFLD